ncbi:MAG TPA: helix-turn-helix transcriptional regulator, partial [Ktedonobacteraceae bacterium]|nr:helix-turn-helix transcriptional regulator [Ktedonobacteraceae bacterium]
MSDMSLHLLNFGDILRAARKRRKLTQKHLAQMLDVHYNTISAWELGSYLPDTRGLVMELAHCLTLDDQESRQLLEASLMAPLPRWNVPYQRNPFFTGCEAVLQEVHDIFQNEQASEQGCICALSGLAGIGKTQCAI